MYRGPRTLVGKRNRYSVSRARGKQAIGQAGMRFIEAQMNPFGSETIGPKSFRALIPDGNGGVSTPVVLTASVTIAPGTANDHGCIGIGPLFADAASANVTRPAIMWSKGAAASPTTATIQRYDQCPNWNESSMFQAAVASHKKFRVVGAGLRCYAISSPDNTQGMVSAALSPNLIATFQGITNATHVTTYSTDFTPYVVEESHPLIGAKAGIHVRRPYQNVDHEYSTLPDASTNGTSATYASTVMNSATTGTLIGNMPMIKYEGVGASTIIRVDACLHLEIQCNSASWPGYLTNSPNEIGFGSIVAFTNSHEVVISGHAFKSFVRSG